jgi:hypothetical protein
MNRCPRRLLLSLLVRWTARLTFLLPKLSEKAEEEDFLETATPRYSRLVTHCMSSPASRISCTHRHRQVSASAEGGDRRRKSLTRGNTRRADECSSLE